jgi:hypothetical protein
MGKPRKTDPQWVIEVCGDEQKPLFDNSDESELGFKQIGKKFVKKFFIDELLEEVEGKAVSSPLVLDIAELVDNEFLSHHTESQHAVLGECLSHLFNTHQIAVRSA